MEKIKTRKIWEENKKTRKIWERKKRKVGKKIIFKSKNKDIHQLNLWIENGVHNSSIDNNRKTTIYNIVFITTIMGQRSIVWTHTQPRNLKMNMGRRSRLQQIAIIVWWGIACRELPLNVTILLFIRCIFIRWNKRSIINELRQKKVSKKPLCKQILW